MLLNDVIFTGILFLKTFLLFLFIESCFLKYPTLLFISYISTHCVDTCTLIYYHYVFLLLLVTFNSYPFVTQNLSLENI